MDDVVRAAARAARRRDARPRSRAYATATAAARLARVPVHGADAAIAAAPGRRAGLGVTLPDVGLPRLMIGGRRIRFTGDIPIGAAVRRESRRKAVVPKGGRSGRFVIVTIQHDVYVEGARVRRSRRSRTT
jgi:hypothetical protein